MPSNEHFTLSILIGGTVIPEYTKNGVHYVECNLTTPVSYKLPEADVIAGEVEKQEWPVTPYSIKIETHNLEETCYFRVLVDGVKVKAVSLGPNAVSIIKGFRDDTIVREFLFSMPRFAKDSNDRLEPGRECNIGSIEVQCWQAELKSSGWKHRHKILNFQQANKKDVYKVTSGEYTMVTSKVGKPLSRRSVIRKVDSWKRKELLSSLKVLYRMGHTLQEMGFTLKPCQISQPSVASGQSAQNADIKQEVRGNSGTQPDDVIKIDDDVSISHLSDTVIDLTADSDEDVKMETAVERPEENMCVDATTGRDVDNHREESMVTTPGEKGLSDSLLASAEVGLDGTKEQSVNDPGQSCQQNASVDSSGDVLTDEDRTSQTAREPATEDAQKCDGTEMHSEVRPDAGETKTAVTATDVTSSDHRNDSDSCLQNSADEVSSLGDDDKATPSSCKEAAQEMSCETEFLREEGK